jgi:hypothetical protein
MQAKPKYVLCPRCELNYFSAEDKKKKYCDVCLAELNLVDPGILIPDEDAELEVLCPVCKLNYMSPDEEMCFLCAKERADKTEKDEDTLDTWGSFLEADDTVDNDLEVSFSELEEEDEDEPFDDPHDTMGEGFDDDGEEEWIDLDDEDLDDEDDEEEKDDDDEEEE